MNTAKWRFLVLVLSAILLTGIAEAKNSEKEQMTMKKIEKSNAEWKKELTPEQYNVLRNQSTEIPFTGEYVNQHARGVYRCAACGTQLFSSETKFDSGTGWPSFWAPISPENIGYEVDKSLFMSRTEVHCPVCGGHLGHVFDDGPAPTGKRYCINSVALKFQDAKDVAEESVQAKPASKMGLETATFAEGCFWGVEETFRKLKGVKSTMVGYTGGHTKNPNYGEVCTGTTGHAEAIEIQFNPKEISYQELLKVFWSSHNPTTKNRQGPDHGEQYRSAIFFHSPEQEKAARESLKALELSGKWKSSIVTEISPANSFWKAEDYHQQYLAKRGKKFCHL